jgi:two-component system sensor histidine kinase CiaH
MQMFQSATLKLTGWYLAILMSISVLFSIAIYQLNFHEVNIRLSNLQEQIYSLTEVTPTLSGSDQLRQAQAEQAAVQMALTLLYINIVIFLGGGIGSYWLARRTLRPLEEAHEAQSRFTSDASHELRTPLATMKTEIEVLLRDKKLNPAEARELLESNLEEVNNLISMSEMLLSLSRFTEDALEKKRVQLATIVQTSLRSFKDSESRFNLSIKRTSTINGNKAALIELSSILVDNALKYSPAGSPIVVRVYQKNWLVTLEVENTGEPINLKALPYIFERFYRGDQSRTNSSKNGYGLGLAIAKKIVDVHGGEITVSSTKKATRFSVFFPAQRGGKNTTN